MAIENYRMSFSKNELLRLHSLINDNFIEQDKELCLKLTMKKLQIEAGLVQPAFIAKNTKYDKDSAGIVRTLELGDPNTSHNVNESFEEMRERKFKQWQNTPHLVPKSELEMIHEYRFTRGWMNTDEFVRYATEISGGFDIPEAESIAANLVKYKANHGISDT